MYLFKLGYLDKQNPNNSIVPSKAAFEKLKETIDRMELDEPCMIWGPELEVEYIGLKQEGKDEDVERISNEIDMDFLEIERIKTKKEENK